MKSRSIVQTRQQLLAGESLKEIVSHYISQIDQKNAELNISVVHYPEESIARAEQIEKKITSGKAGTLAGSVFGIKDVLNEKGKVVSCASNMLRNFKSVYNATAIQKLLDEDAILLSRLNMDEFAMGSSTENSIYGPSRNPHNPDRVTGGSSGGSAAAVAADMANAALGSDTGGSIRQPASYCGVVGLKPSYGRVSRYGLVAYASSFDSIGPLTQTVEDAALVLSVIAGRDNNDGSSSFDTVPDYLSALNATAKGLRIGVPKEYFSEGLDPEIHQQILDRLKQFESDGATLVPVSLPHTPYAIATYYILATAEASSNLARYDGVRFGHRADQKKIREELKVEEKVLRDELKLADEASNQLIHTKLNALDSPLIRLYKETRSEGFGIEVKRRIMLGTYVLSAGYYDAYYGKAQRIRRLIRQDFDRAFASCDVIVSPTAPTTAFPLGDNQDDPIKMYLNDIYTISANLAGICGISIPIGFHSDGLPIGMQFMGAAFDEISILKAGRITELQ
ncbi:MAG: Asp-tRNA(Asn)/Glu-tRNA(Gln) amidotransferase subunit GatA [Bacteroidetes bacterium]|nr:Asp-tRNA(Asn)/Glu-tRNA(Gln) amidotransferase subunit GatA [Bacteroidota bacterium]MCH8523263.1 aspartyl/glutamyl-tRNA amidotransferase subunit A [Balneolales bacterium]